jgi:4-hydroxybenzoate polyprenyltransferase
VTDVAKKPALPLALLKALRPKQWAKNGLLWAALLFSQKYTDVDAVMKVALGTALFSMLSSAGYLFNDLRDIESDRKHPEKRFRPLAAGHVPPQLAWATSAVFLVVGVAGSFLLLPQRFGIAAVCYLVITLSYSSWFKHVVLLDVMLLASGFLVRAVAGAEAIGVVSSPWFLVCTGFGALFIGLNKRLAEINRMQGDAGATRKILEEYTPRMLEQFISVSTACTLISYALYTFSGEHPRSMMGTIPFVMYGVLRYMYLVENGAGGAPEKILFRDRPMQVCLLAYCVATVAVLQLG